MQDFSCSLPFCRLAFLFMSASLLPLHPFFLKRSGVTRFSLLPLGCVTPCSKHLRWLWTQSQFEHLNFHLKREMLKNLTGEWSVMDCDSQPNHMRLPSCSWPAESGTTSKGLCSCLKGVFRYSAFQRQNQALLWSPELRFQVGNSSPSFLASKHGSLPCQPRT